MPLNVKERARFNKIKIKQNFLKLNFSKYLKRINYPSRDIILDAEIQNDKNKTLYQSAWPKSYIEFNKYYHRIALKNIMNNDNKKDLFYRRIFMFFLLNDSSF